MNLTFSILLVLGLGSLLQAGQIPASQIRLATAVWNFNEESGTIAYDAMGNVNGTVTGGIRSFYPGFGVGIRFAGTAGDGVQTADPLASLPANSPKTYIVMYRPFQITAGNQFLMSQNNGTNANTLSITHRTIDNGTIDIQAGMNPGAGTTLTLTAFPLIRANVPVVIAVTASTLTLNSAGGLQPTTPLPAGINVWINGDLVGSSVTTCWNGSAGTLGIGINAQAGNANATGDIMFAAVLKGIPTRSEMKKIARDLLETDITEER